MENDKSAAGGFSNIERATTPVLTLGIEKKSPMTLIFAVSRDKLGIYTLQSINQSINGFFIGKLLSDETHGYNSQ